jgi:DNA polymerase IV (family X)
MSEGIGMGIGAAKAYAELFVYFIRDTCEKVEIAGSIRRRKPKVHDIEIVAVPKYKIEKEVLLDGVREKQVNQLHLLMTSMLQSGKVTSDRQRKDKHRDPFGERYYRVNYNVVDLKIPIDLFVVMPPSQWGTQFLIRTGCAEFSHWIVSQRINQGLHFKDGHLEHDVTGVIDTPTEESVFKALRLPYVPPEQREMDEQGKPMWVK